MKILHYSDKHDEKLPELYKDCDAMFCTGDLTVLDFYGVYGKPMFGVYGNHCSGRYFPEVGVTNVHLQVVQWNGLKIGGFQGSIRYKEGGGPQYTQEESQTMLIGFPPVDILLLHSPPFGLLDDPNDPVHTGFQATRDYIDRYHSKFVFCGHLYENAELEYGVTKIFRTYRARIIEI